jgi:opacity protein-like surface antigen
MKKLIVALIATAAAMSAAQAQTTAPRGYIGVGAATAKNMQSDDYKTSGKIYGGVQVNPMWAAEAGYTDFRNADYNIGGNNASSKGYGYYVAGKASLPINEQFSAYGKVGVQHSERKLEALGSSLKDTDTGLYGALGAEFKLNQQVSLVAEYERYGKDKAFGAKADVWTVGAHYNF